MEVWIVLHNDAVGGIDGWCLYGSESEARAAFEDERREHAEMNTEPGDTTRDVDGTPWVACFTANGGECYTFLDYQEVRVPATV